MQTCQKIFIDTKDYVHNQCLEMITEHNDVNIQPEYKEYKKTMNEKHLKIIRQLDRLDDLAEQVANVDNLVKTKAEDQDLHSLTMEVH